MQHPYCDIIHLPRPASLSRPRMPIGDRAAQFSPFAALTGFGDVIRETGRFTEPKRELEESAIEELERKLRLLGGKEREHPLVAATYFLPDERKEGGAYLTVTGRMERIDAEGRALVFADGNRIPIENILKLEELPGETD